MVATLSGWTVDDTLFDGNFWDRSDSLKDRTAPVGAWRWTSAIVIHVAGRTLKVIMKYL